MQRMWKQSPKQSIGLHDIRLHTKSPATKITWTYRGGGGRPLRLPPGSATGCCWFILMQQTHTFPWRHTRHTRFRLGARKTPVSGVTWSRLSVKFVTCECE